MIKITVPEDAVGVRFQKGQTPTIQFVGTCLLPLGGYFEITEGIESALEIIREILGITDPSTELRSSLGYEDGSIYFKIRR